MTLAAKISKARWHVQQAWQFVTLQLLLAPGAAHFIQHVFMRLNLAPLALLLSSAAYASPPAPIVLDCPAQSADGRPATTFVWDGASLREVLTGRQPTVWKVASSSQKIEPGPTIDTRTLSFNLAQGPAEVAEKKQTLIGLQLSEFKTAGPIPVLFQMAVLEDGFLTGAIAATFLGCVSRRP